MEEKAYTDACNDNTVQSLSIEEQYIQITTPNLPGGQ